MDCLEVKHTMVKFEKKHLLSIVVRSSSEKEEKLWEFSQLNSQFPTHESQTFDFNR